MDTRGTLERTQPTMKPLKLGKPYLIFVCLEKGRDRPGHAEVLESLRLVSCSQPTHLLGDDMDFYGFRSTLSMGEISQVLGAAKNFLDDDSYVVIELASDYLVLHADSAKTWLRENLF
jgi:hypothetical protein